MTLAAAFQTPLLFDQGYVFYHHFQKQFRYFSPRGCLHKEEVSCGRLQLCFTSNASAIQISACTCRSFRVRIRINWMAI